MVARVARDSDCLAAGILVQSGSVKLALSFALVLSLPLGLTLTGSAAQAAGRTFSVLSLFYPASTNRDPDIDASFRLSLFHSRAGTLRGLDLNGIVSQASGDVRGLQGNGVYGQVRGGVRGIQISGALNYVAGEVRGLQGALIGNYVRGGARGFQLGGIVNYNELDFRGLQLTGGLNLTEGYSFGLQISTLANVTNGDARGAQVSSFLNATSGRLRGLQLGAANLAAHSSGAQIGLLNFTRSNRGLQVAAVNVSTEQTGVPVGLVNLSEQGNVDLVVFGSNLMGANAGVRTTVNRFYSFLAVGGFDLHDGDESEAASVSWNFGYAAPVTPRFRLGGDLGFVHIVPSKQQDPTKNDETHFAVQARALGEALVSRTFSIFLALGGSAVASDYSASATTDFDPHVAAGVSLF